MANESRITIRISADGTAAVESFGKVTGSVKKLESDTGGIVGKIKEHWLGLSAAALGAYATISKGWSYLEMGAKAMQAEESFYRVAESYKQNANMILEQMKRVSAGTVDDSDIMQKAVKGMVQGLAGEQLIRIMEAARISARVAGEDVRTAYETITDSLANNMPRALIRYGLVTRDQMKIINLALAQGIDDVRLYELAMLNAEVQTASFGKITKSAAEELQEFNALVNDVKESIGVGLYRAIYGIGYAFMEVGKSIISPIMLMELAFNRLGIAGSHWQGTFAEQSRISEEWRKKMLGISDAAQGTGTSVEAARDKLAKMMADLQGQIDMKKRLEEEKKAAEEIEKIMQEVHDRELLLGLDAEETARKQLEIKLDNEISRLQKLKAAKEKIEEAERIRRAAMDDLDLRQADARNEKMIESLHTLRDREALIGKEGDAKELAQLEITHFKEIEAQYKLKADEEVINEYYRVQKLERDEMVRRQTIARDQKILEEQKRITAAANDLILSTLQNRLDIERKLDEFKVRTGTMVVGVEFVDNTFLAAEEEALRRRYGYEREILTTKKDQLISDWSRVETTEDILKRLGEIYNVQQSLTALDKYEVFDLQVLKIRNIEKMIQLSQQQLDLEKQRYELSWRSMMDMANQIGGQAGMGFGKMTSGLKQMMDTQRGEDVYSQQIMAAKAYYQSLVAQHKAGLLEKWELDVEYARNEKLQQALMAQQEFDLYSNGFQAVSGVMQAFYVLSGQKSKEFFFISKMFGVAQILINGLIAASGAAASQASIPYVGPILAVTAFAAMLAFITAAAESAQSVGPGSTPGSYSAGGGGYSYKSPTTPSWQIEEEKVRPMAINVNVYGSVIGSTPDEIARSLVPLIRKAQDDGVF